MASSGVSCGSSSANTPHSRIRRAMSCEYCPPKSSTSTSSRPRAAPGGVLGRSRAERATLPASLPGAARASRAAARASVIRYRYRLGHRGAAVRAHADRLLSLELLAFSLKRRSHHHLGALEVADVLVTAGGHRRPQGAEEVERAVILVRWAEQ